MNPNYLLMFITTILFFMTCNFFNNRKYPVKPVFPLTYAPGILILHKREGYQMNTPASTLADNFRRSGKTQQVYCSENNISIHTLRYYLYKKSQRGFFRTPRHKQPDSDASAVPSFISFNRETHPENTTRPPLTVIHGFFSIAELVEILSTVSTRQ